MKEKYTSIFIILLVLNITVLLVSNIIASKLVLLVGLTITAADLLFPITYILNDVFVEVYGYKRAKVTIILSFFANLLMVLVFLLASSLPYPEYYLDQNAFTTVLMNAPRILIASILAYFVGSFVNSKVMIYLKNKSKLFTRIIVSTIIGELIDTFVFTFVAFVGVVSNIELVVLILNVYIVKVFIELLISPLTTKLIKYIKLKESINE